MQRTTIHSFLVNLQAEKPFLLLKPETSNFYFMITRIAILGLALASLQVQAQTFPEKDGTTTQYYRIMSAAAAYSGQDRCLEDISGERRSFSYAVKPYSADSKLQDWTFLTESASDDTYHLRNRSNFRYISTAAVGADNYMTLPYVAKKQTTDALKFTPIGDNQYTISFSNEDDECYLAATDLEHPTTTMPKKLNNTIWAWYVYTSKALEDGILEHAWLTPQIGVQGRHIVVSGAAQWQIMDMQGRTLPNSALLQPGVYVVTADRHTQKVLVQ